MRSIMGKTVPGAILTVALILSTAIPGIGEETPASLQDTMEWIKGMLEGNAGWQEGGVRPYQLNGGFTSVKSEECNLHWEEWDFDPTSLAKDNKLVYRKRSVDVALRTLDPLTLRSEKGNKENLYWVVLETSRSKRTIHTVETFAHLNSNEDQKLLPPPRTVENNAWRIGFSNNDHSVRTTNALKHAIKLCGGKVDPF